MLTPTDVLLLWPNSRHTLGCSFFSHTLSILDYQSQHAAFAISSIVINSPSTSLVARSAPLRAWLAVTGQIHLLLCMCV